MFTFSLDFPYRSSMRIVNFWIALGLLCSTENFFLDCPSPKLTLEKDIVRGKVVVFIVWSFVHETLFSRARMGEDRVESGSSWKQIVFRRSFLVLMYWGLKLAFKGCGASSSSDWPTKLMNVWYAESVNLDVICFLFLSCVNYLNSSIEKPILARIFVSNSKLVFNISWVEFIWSYLS